MSRSENARLSATRRNDTRAAGAEIVASAHWAARVAPPGIFTRQKLPTIARHIVITSDTIARAITRYGRSLEHNLPLAI